MIAILLHQVHDHLLSLRFQLAFLILFAFFAAASALYGLRLSNLQRDMVRINAENENRYERYATVSAATSGGYRLQAQPPGTEFIAEGNIEHLLNAAWVTPASGTLIGKDRAITINGAMMRYDLVDWTWIAKYVLSFLCIVLAYDAVSGERESGTLRLVMANPLSRLTLVAGKCLGNAAILFGSVIAATAFGLFYLSITGSIVLNANVWSAYLAFLAATLIYILLFVGFSIGVSALTSNSSTGVVILVLTWAITVVVIPQTSSLIASRVVGVDITEGWAPGGLIDEERDNLMGEGIAPRGREAGRPDSYAMEKAYARRMEAADARAHQRLRDVDDRLSRQFRLARNVNLLSPGFALQYPVEALLGTGVLWRDHFHQQMPEYRQTLREFLEVRDASDPDSPHVPFLAEYMSKATLNTEEIPRFESRPLDLTTRVRLGLVPILVLVFETAAALAFAGWAAWRMEIATQ